MTRYRDPNAPEGRVVFGGEAFIDGVTADINPGPCTLSLFKGTGITPVDAETVETETEPVPDETQTTPDETPAAKPASRRSK